MINPPKVIEPIQGVIKTVTNKQTRGVQKTKSPPGTRVRIQQG